MQTTPGPSSPLFGNLQYANPRGRITSRMIERYLTDIEETARHDEAAALRAALALPLIATALEQSDRRTSCERFAAWCARWVGSGETSSSETSESALYSMWCERSGCDELAATDGIPVSALWQLRLRRHARPSPLLSLPISAGLMEHHFDAFVSAALVQAMRRWYDEHGARSSLVQRNLAHLAILR